MGPKFKDLTPNDLGSEIKMGHSGIVFFNIKNHPDYVVKVIPHDRAGNRLVAEVLARNPHMAPEISDINPHSGAFIMKKIIPSDIKPGDDVTAKRQRNPILTQEEYDAVHTWRKKNINAHPKYNLGNKIYIGPQNGPGIMMDAGIGNIGYDRSTKHPVIFDPLIKPTTFVEDLKYRWNRLKRKNNAIPPHVSWAQSPEDLQRLRAFTLAADRNTANKIYNGHSIGILGKSQHYLPHKIVAKEVGKAGLAVAAGALLYNEAKKRDLV